MSYVGLAFIFFWPVVQVWTVTPYPYPQTRDECVAVMTAWGKTFERLNPGIAWDYECKPVGLEK